MTAAKVDELTVASPQTASSSRFQAPLRTTGNATFLCA
ncbi:hypothetical protein RISK_005936 [Rhodopirellula islandica]|uniref:Uncharacterized protein n=1 Tax=Rhodopirellula islandica TaxID=595434 RepID=A0A0J1B5K8_RHOIS|nr:hypothetical protein RISK_005936 [Rhodopirellula islandica]